MPRPTDVNDHADEESRRKGGRRSGEVRRERAKTLRDRIADRLEAEADLVVGVFIDAMKANTGYFSKDGEFYESTDHPTRLRAATAALKEAFGNPVQEHRHSGDRDEPIVFEISAAKLRKAAEILDDATAPPDQVHPA
jgi:hypothetical protein